MRFENSRASRRWAQREALLCVELSVRTRHQVPGAADRVITRRDRTTGNMFLRTCRYCRYSEREREEQGERRNEWTTAIRGRKEIDRRRKNIVCTSLRTEIRLPIYIPETPTLPPPLLPLFRVHHAISFRNASFFILLSSFCRHHWDGTLFLPLVTPLLPPSPLRSFGRFVILPSLLFLPSPAFK